MSVQPPRFIWEAHFTQFSSDLVRIGFDRDPRPVWPVTADLLEPPKPEVHVRPA